MLPLPILAAAVFQLSQQPVRLEPGAWAEYELAEPGRTASRVRASMLPSGRPEAAARLEITLGRADAAALPLVLQVDLDAKGAQLGARLRAPGSPAIELPAELLKEEQGQRSAAEPAGRERVRAAGRAFAAEVSRSGGWTRWTSREVPIWGLVRAVRGSSRLTLRGFGRSGARSLLPGAAQGKGRDSEKK